MQPPRTAGKRMDRVSDREQSRGDLQLYEPLNLVPVQLHSVDRPDRPMSPSYDGKNE